MKMMTMAESESKVRDVLSLNLLTKNLEECVKYILENCYVLSNVREMSEI